MRISTLIVPALLLGATGMAAAQIDPSFGGPVDFVNAPPEYIPIPASPYALRREKMAAAKPRYLLDFYTVNTGVKASAEAPANVQLVNDPADPASARKVFKLAMDRGDTPVFGGWRAEVSPRTEYAMPGQVRWYAISLFFPKDWVEHADMTLVSQLHTSQHAFVSPPPVALVMRNGDLSLAIRANHRRPSDDALLPGELSVADPATVANTAYQHIQLTKVNYGQWYCFVMRSDWSYTPGVGGFKLWMNGEVAYEAKNLHLGYKTWLGNYPKAGMYWPGTMRVEHRSIYTDFIHLGGANTTYEEMAAKTPCAK